MVFDYATCVADKHFAAQLLAILSPVRINLCFRKRRHIRKLPVSIQISFEIKSLLAKYFFNGTDHDPLGGETLHVLKS